MQDYEEERKTYVGLIGAFVLIKKFKFAVENGKLFIILEQFEFCGLQGTPQVGSPTQIGSGKGDYWDEINFFLEFLKETDAIPSVLDHDHAESAVNIENAEIKPLDPPTPLKPVANTLNQKFIGWDNFDLDDDQVSVSIQEQNTLKAIILPPAQVQNSSVTNTIIFPVSTTTAVSGSQALIHSDFDEYDGISDEALLQLELDSQSTQSDDRMIDLVADSDEEERCESDREDEQVQMRITQTKPTIERTRSTSYCSKGLMTKPPYASAESDSEVETVEHPEISSKTTPQEFRIQENACASHHNRSDKAIKTLPVPASFAELSDEELFEDAIDFQTSNGDTMPKQAKFTELSDEELFEDALGEDRVEGEQDKEDQKMSQPQSIEMLDLFSQSPTSQKIHISQSDHGDDLFTQNEFKVIETSAAFIPEESDDPKAAVQPLLASTVETVKMPGVEAPVEHSAENDFDEIAADRADGIFPAKHMEIDKNEEVAAGTPKVANNHLINEEPEVNGLTAISVPNAESFAVKQVNPFEDPENEDKPDFKSDEEEDAEASPTSPSLSSKSDSEAELLEALVDFDGITEDNYAQEKIVNAFQESVCLDSYLSQEHQTEIPDFISQVVSLESISNEDFKLVMDYSQDGNEEFRNTTQACCLLTQEISDSMPYSKLLESDEKMESKIERTEVVVESQLEVEKVTEVFLGLNNGTVIEE